MGIRFKCHHCHAPLNIKSELASKRGVCPECHGKFRIPRATQEFSLSLDVAEPASLDTKSIEAPRTNVAPVVEEPLRSPAHRSTSGAADALAIEAITQDGAPVEQLYVVRPPSGGEYGPASRETIELWITQRRVTADTLVCLIGTSQWRKARDVFSTHFGI
jgi:acetyl-CoA carboxylase beta subunit